MLLQHIRNLLAQAAGALDIYPLYLVVDRATIHHEERIMQEFHDWGCQELVQLLKMPPAAAKRLSPLDNSLFNLWRQRVTRARWQHTDEGKHQKTNESRMEFNYSGRDQSTISTLRPHARPRCVLRLSQSCRTSTWQLRE